MSRRAYHLDYHQRTRVRRRKLAREGKTRRLWAPRLVDAVLAELRMPESARDVSTPRPIQRPTLRLPRAAQ